MSYSGKLDVVVAPWGLAKAGAVTEMRIAYAHKQSAAQKQLYREVYPKGFEVALLLHPQLQCVFRQESPQLCFLMTAALGRALPLPLKTAGLLVCVQRIGRIVDSSAWP